MKKIFLSEIIENVKELVLKNDIKVESIKNKELNFKGKAEQVDLFSQKCIMRITIFENGRMYIHVINIHTEETLYFFDDYVNDEFSAKNLIINAIETMSV
ncbi:MAG: hypothetical protein Q4B93_05205 [Clostridia bacterium]|nr:hypothetical protein [Clostridia bacterium]